MVEELFSYYLTLTPCTLWDVKCHCEQLTYHCHTVLNYYLKKTDDSWKASPNMQAIVNTLFSSDEVKAYYMQFFLNITSLLKKQSVYNTGELIDQIQFYIQRNYQKKYHPGIHRFPLLPEPKLSQPAFQKADRTKICRLSE